jgi:GTP1/Obg family GTP-binding protein
MESKERQLMELLGLTAKALTHMTASITSMSFELLRSDDETTRQAGRRMIERMASISSELDRHWSIIGELTGEQSALNEVPSVEEIHLQGVVPRLPAG